MTLIVGRSDGEQAWMIADTAITDPKAGLRDRLHDLKIELLQQTAIVGYAGNPTLARRIVNRAKEAPTGSRTLEILARARKDNPGPDLAYAFWDGQRARLYKMKTTNQKPEEVSTLYLGQQLWFDRFQRARNSKKIVHAPKAVHTLIIDSNSNIPVPGRLADDIKAMLNSFVDTSDREVGGWPVAYFVNREGAFFVRYAYMVTDPIVDELQAGSLIPFGTTEGGGFSFSLTELGNGVGVVAYWLQKPGGYVLIRSRDGVAIEAFDGRPREFIVRFM
jgi:hypothetical protein